MKTRWIIVLLCALVLLVSVFSGVGVAGVDLDPTAASERANRNSAIFGDGTTNRSKGFSHEYQAAGSFSVAPILTVVTPVPAYTYITSPSYTFNSSAPGTIDYIGICSSTSSTAVEGDNAIVLTNGGAPFSEGMYSGCAITVTNAGGTSDPLTISSFTIDTTPRRSLSAARQLLSLKENWLSTR